MAERLPLQVPEPGGSEGQFLHHLLRSLLRHMLHTGMLRLHGQHPVKARLHMGCIFPCSHHQSKSYPVRIQSDAGSDHSQFCLQYPKARPSQMGTGIPGQ